MKLTIVFITREKLVICIDTEQERVNAINYVKEFGGYLFHFVEKQSDEVSNRL